jgi:hypothetical protein
VITPEMYAIQPILLSCRIFASPGVEKCVLSHLESKECIYTLSRVRFVLDYKTGFGFDDWWIY